MPQFDSGAAKQIGRFSERLLLQLLHIALSWSVPLPIILWSLLNDRQMTQTSDRKILKAAAVQ
jgi:hypothetical protein